MFQRKIRQTFPKIPRMQGKLHHHHIRKRREGIPLCQDQNTHRDKNKHSLRDTAKQYSLMGHSKTVHFDHHHHHHLSFSREGRLGTTDYFTTSLFTIQLLQNTLEWDIVHSTLWWNIVQQYSYHHRHHHHLSFSREGRWGTTDYFTTSLFTTVQVLQQYSWMGHSTQYSLMGHSTQHSGGT